MKTMPVQCVKCGNVDHVEDSIISLALHKCSICQATGGRIRIEDLTGTLEIRLPR